MLSILWNLAAFIVALGVHGAAESASNDFPLVLEKRFGGVPIN